jgi:hypothetical protein
MEGNEDVRPLSSISPADLRRVREIINEMPYSADVRRPIGGINSIGDVITYLEHLRNVLKEVAKENNVGQQRLRKYEDIVEGGRVFLTMLMTEDVNDLIDHL